MQYKGWDFPENSDLVLRGLLALGLGTAALSALILAWEYFSPDVISHAHLFGSFLRLDVPATFFGYLVFALPIVGVMHLDKAGPADAALVQHHLWQATLLGMIAGALVWIIGFAGGVFVSPVALPFSSLGLLPGAVISALGEEFVFRGFLQTRLMYRFGNPAGWVAQALLTVSVHLVLRMLLFGFSPFALVAALGMFPLALLLGFLLIRTENLATCVIYHALVKWLSFL